MAEYADMKPTEKARLRFQGAGTTSQLARTFAEEGGVIYRTMVADSLNGLALGLEEMATGIRATYILLDQIKRSLEK
ncbi:MAG: hypothetical protein ABI539_02505 [Acidobacteriota bacterium]